MNTLIIELIEQKPVKIDLSKNIEYECILLKFNDNINIDDKIFEKKFIKLDEELYKNKYERLIMKDNSFIYIKVNYLNIKINEYISTININDLNIQYCNYLVSLVGKNDQDTDIFKHLNNITKPIIEFIFKNSKEVLQNNETKSHLLLIEKIQKNINKKFGFKFKI